MEQAEYQINKKFKREYPNHPVVWVENDGLQSYFYVREPQNSEICVKCLGWIPPAQCADCRKLEPWWYTGILGLFCL